MRVLVTGVGGQMGFAVCKRLAALGIERKGTDLADFDITDERQTYSAIVSYSPDFVVHCAAWTAVDRAESNAELCRKVNRGGTENIAEACRKINAAMVYLSTDYVFDGLGETPFETDSAICPISVYGKTKAEGEAAVRDLLSRYFIVRTSWVFGANGNNFVNTMLRLGKEKESLKVVCDQIGSPTYSDDLARLLCDMIKTERYGTYHATNEGYCSWSDFAAEIMRKARLSCRILPIPTSEYPAAAKRPMNSRLSKQSLDKAGFERLPAWQDALKRYLESGKEKDIHG